MLNKISGHSLCSPVHIAGSPLSRAPKTGSKKMKAAFARAQVAARDREMEAASRHLREALKNATDVASRAELLKELITLNVMRSRNKEAILDSQTLRQILLLDKPCRWLSLRISFSLLGLLYLLLPGLVAPLSRLVVSLLFPSLRGRHPDFEQVRAVQFALFWDNIRDCLPLSIVQIALAKTAQQRVAALRWIGYVGCQLGHSQVGVAILRKLIRDCQRQNLTEGQDENYLCLALGLHYIGKGSQTVNTWAQFWNEYPNPNEFYQQLSLANLINHHLSEGRLLNASSYLNEAFFKAFSLNISRHHIHIYGAKAALLSLEGRDKEARACLRKAELAATRNDETLDYLVFHRISSIVHMQLGDLTEAHNSLAQALTYHKKFGQLNWYRMELSKLRHLLAIHKHPRSLCRRFFHAALFLLEGLARGNTSLTGRALRLLPDLLGSHVNHYWSKSRVISYLTSIRQNDSLTRLKLITNITCQTTEALLLPYSSEGPIISVEALLSKIRFAFSSDYVLHGRCMAEIINRLRSDGLVVSILNESSAHLRVACSDGSFFFAVEAPKTKEFNEDLIVGVGVNHLDTQSDSLFEGTLRVLLTQYVFVRSIECSRDAFLAEQKKAVIAEATQMLAHDIRRPFTTLLLALETIRNSERPSEIKRLSTLLLSDVENAIKTVNAMLVDVIEANSTMLPRLQFVPIESVIESSLVEVKNLHPVPLVTFKCQVLDSCKVSADPVKIQRVFVNLLENAIQAMGGHGTIWISTYLNGEAFLYVVIGNDGPPIDVKDQGRVFEPFFSKKNQGNGLGLYIARKIINDHGGSISCASSGTRTEFTLSLPIA